MGDGKLAIHVLRTLCLPRLKRNQNDNDSNPYSDPPFPAGRISLLRAIVSTASRNTHVDLNDGNNRTPPETWWRD